MTSGSQGAFEAARRIVFKVGSALLVDAETGAANRAWLEAFCADAADLRAAGKQVLVVSSGAVALGRRRLGLTGRKTTLPEKQAAAAAGQSLLMRAWEEAFEPHGIGVAQILLTRDDTEMRRRWLNARATTETLMGLGVVPVVNENDTVVTEEIRYGDNDRLAARVAQMAGADLLVLLSDIDGLYTADPRKNPKAQHIPRVSEITPEIAGMAEGANAAAGVGTGGMATKIAAARIARAAGCATLITLGSRPRPLAAIAAGEKATLIEAGASPAAAYKAWIAGSLAPQGWVTVDAGAASALLAGKSLLPAGVRAVEGPFDKGDAVRVRDENGREVARGLVRYDSADAQRIAGLRSDAIEAELGFTEGPMIHADDLAVAH
ncbi:glutamate 5-kinase [Caulobacter vibrioides]|uniref:Glutamate 5-kinase n=2 Tax=Caulobacter vibrioides TaxID=155892 RepID=PROB_CAUVC|nr:glutamate 5-kinase [Caulobacter vibrioides]YP_002515691.1 glutamate 5-kinase [Caulobacter vibrioides NA1000]B8GYI6.1 RecName: Full=Glutamate 5-kinase; AltName: Full=Gamma-glutamyl kinase; Short=GK [Caulobacter vibrioides NA1000]Q9ABB6.1 RecName: Full=Glutamate 5-kinase; AltName: Full=Gamma-glutamyl kinase; Short=GK [Caulobacter vibrioides CB15]AAK22301.1 glutamate 5-kinase [Caulobacter vibrioides CB15]ACL93783.1 glutamate 5-kinase [Caulobacter vibrioides NA1000]ATC27145.1 glutamate 5-kinas